MLNPKGGTFGGTCEKTELFAKYYDEMLDKSLQEGFLGTLFLIGDILAYHIHLL